MQFFVMFVTAVCVLFDIYKLMRELTNEEGRECWSRCETKNLTRSRQNEPSTFIQISWTKNSRSAGHVPKLMATWLTRFFKRQTNCGTVVLKENRVNRRGDFGLTVPCEYIFEEDDLFCEWLHRKDRRGIYNLERCLGLNVFSTDRICIFVWPHALVVAI